jgi:hypothetical protein
MSNHVDNHVSFGLHSSVTNTNGYCSACKLCQSIAVGPWQSTLLSSDWNTQLHNITSHVAVTPQTISNFAASTITTVDKSKKQWK